MLDEGLVNNTHWENYVLLSSVQEFSLFLMFTQSINFYTLYYHTY